VIDTDVSLNDSAREIEEKERRNPTNSSGQNRCITK
jgi:hypothetical protein